MSIVDYRIRPPGATGPEGGRRLLHFGAVGVCPAAGGPGGASAHGAFARGMVNGLPAGALDFATLGEALAAA